MKRRISIAILLSVFCASSLLAGIFPSHVALAANKYPLSNIQWVNNNTIKATTSGIAGFPALYFFDTNDGVDPDGYGIGSGGRTFKVQPGYPCANSYIFVSYLTGTNTSSGYYDTAHNVLSFATPPGTNGACQYINYLANKQPPPTGISNPVDAGVQVQDPKLSLQDNDSSVTGVGPVGTITPRPFYTSDILYTIADDGKSILRTNGDKKSWTFTQTAASSNVFTQGSAACSPTIVANPGAGKFTMYELEPPNSTDGSTPVTADSAAAKAMGGGVGCNIVNQGGRGQTSNIASGVGSGFDEPLGNSSNLAPPTVQQPINSTIQNPTSQPACEASGGTLTWLLCGVYNAFASITDWMLTNLVQPLLKSDPISTDPSDPTYQIWSNFRNYGDIFLVIALLVVVFAEVIGGGLIDAYTVRKVLPRILVAAILINLSVYIVALLVDITNIIGGGIGALITAPLKGAGEFQFSLGNSAAGGVVGLSAGGIAVFLTAAGGAAGLAGAALPLILLSVIMPALVGLLAALVTIVLRKGLILFLVMISPVAFALYALPNTQQYFKKWWDLLLATLLVYPIIMVIFAVADVLSVTIMSANSTIDPNNGYFANLASGFSNNALAPIVSFVALFLPLVMIPYAFRLAGGAIGKIHETLTDRHKKAQEFVKGNPNDPNSMRNRYRTNFGARMTRNRANTYRGLAGRNGFGRLASTIYGNSIEKEALLNQASKQRIFNIKDNGDDRVVNARASFIDRDGLYGAKGDRRTLDGKKVEHADWLTAKAKYPNLSDMQAVADYRSTKINTTEEAHDFARNFGLMAQDQGLSANEATGMYTALAFARQNERGEFKYGQYTQGADGKFSFHAAGDTGSFMGDVDPSDPTKTITAQNSRSANFIKEQYAKKGTYAGSQMFSSYFQSMGDIKKTHLDRLASGTLTADQQKHSKGQLKQIMEIEDAFSRGGSYRDPATGAMIDTGLSGASAETQAAFKKMQLIGATHTGASTAPTLTDANLVAIRGELNRGESYESENSPAPGDFTTRYS